MLRLARPEPVEGRARSRRAGRARACGRTKIPLCQSGSTCRSPNTRRASRGRHHERAATSMKQTADVVIVGGGCMGASVAYHLTRRGLTNIVIVERERMLGTGSTGRNAGGVRHQFSNAANISLSIESIDLIKRFAEEVGHPVDFHQDGYLFLLSSEASVATFRRNVALQRSMNVDVQWLDGADAERLAPGLKADDVIGATFCQKDGIADPN